MNKECSAPPYMYILLGEVYQYVQNEGLIPHAIFSYADLIGIVHHYCDTNSNYNAIADTQLWNEFRSILIEGYAYNQECFVPNT